MQFSDKQKAIGFFTIREMETIFLPVIIISLKVIVKVKGGSAVKEEECLHEDKAWKEFLISAYFLDLFFFFPFCHVNSPFS